jgi:PAS domain S-box-containing protein
MVPLEEGAEKALREQLHFLQTLIDTIPNPIFYKDTHEEFLGCNKAFEQRLGLTREQIVGKTSHDLFPGPLADEYQLMDRALLENPGEQIHETSLHYADGKRHEVIINKGTFTDTAGKVSGLVGVTIDITERKRAEAALQAAHDELERRVEQRTAELAKANAELRNEIAERERAEEALQQSAERLKRFAYSVVHDLKSPAIGVHGFANLLSRHYQDFLDDKGKRYCRQILKAAEHLAALVEAINTFIATKEAPLAIERVAMPEVLREVRGEFSVRLKARHVSWVEGAEMPDIRADRLSMIRIFTNLVDNALKYGGDGLSKISVIYEATETFHVFSVNDDGVGMSWESAEKLFQFFQRGKSSRGVQGAGLGLAIVRETAERHGGMVAVEQGQAGGTTFRVSIARDL